MLAKGLIQTASRLIEARELLGETLETARKSGYLNEVAVINKLLKENE